jgi:hypothetical protein
MNDLNWPDIALILLSIFWVIAIGGWINANISWNRAHRRFEAAVDSYNAVVQEIQERREHDSRGR